MRPHWKELLDWIKPEKFTAKDIERMEGLQPGEYEIHNEKLNNFLLEAREVFIRMGISSMLRSGDLAVGIYTADGDIVNSSTGTIIHTMTTLLPIKFVVKNWLDEPTVGIKEGDIFYSNEALYGGVHNPDQMAFMPVFNDGELIAWVAAVTHEPETGGTEAGGMVLTAKSRHYEGMKLSPIKIGENYQVRADMIEMMENFISRAPRMQTIDVKARCAACDRLRLRIQQLAQEKGNEFMRGLFCTTIRVAEEGAKKVISKWHDGTFRGVLFHDSVAGQDHLQRIYCTVRKEGEQVTFDFKGTSPENDAGSSHGFPHTLATATGMYLFPYPFHSLPFNAGSFTPFEWIVPEGCLWNPSPEAAVSNSGYMTWTVFGVLFPIFAKIIFTNDRKTVTGTTAGCGGGNIIAGINQYGVPVADIMAYPLNSAGQGARSDMDGTDSFGFAGIAAGSRGPDAEDVENEYPLLHLFQKHIRDGGGHGKYRGGTGVQSAYIVHHVPWLAYNCITAESKLVMSQGVFGGYPPSPFPGIDVRNTDIWEKMANAENDIPSDTVEMLDRKALKGDYVIQSEARPTKVLMNGDIFLASALGGGGYGDVLERDPLMVIKDLQKDLISHWAAKNVYHIAYDPDTLVLDLDKTAELRQNEREERKMRGLKPEDFKKEWAKLKPPEEVLDLYGSWPDAEKVRDVIRI
ncbi:hydantoinase B/oxoprolinase [delta proteobacterium NaphS2]|nr:hydantoinase B/oxoprolinase [delta proteobacterium NaphS2]